MYFESKEHPSQYRRRYVQFFHTLDWINRIDPCPCVCGITGTGANSTLQVHLSNLKFWDTTALGRGRPLHRGTWCLYSRRGLATEMALRRLPGSHAVAPAAIGVNCPNAEKQDAPAMESSFTVLVSSVLDVCNCCYIQGFLIPWFRLCFLISEQLSEEASFTSRPVLWCRSLHELRGNWLWWIYELHQWSLHCHHDVLDEEDDGCHFWYWQKRIGASRSSPDSWWRRCIFVNASLKSDRSFIGACLPDVFREIDQVFLYLSNSSGEGRQVKSFCANSSISMHFSSVRPTLSCESRNLKSFGKRSTSAINYSLIPIKKAFWALHFWNCFA